MYTCKNKRKKERKKLTKFQKCKLTLEEVLDTSFGDNESLIYPNNIINVLVWK